jgi:hypothetical protein
VAKDDRFARFGRRPISRELFQKRNAILPARNDKRLVKTRGDVRIIVEKVGVF